MPVATVGGGPNSLGHLVGLVASILSCVGPQHRDEMIPGGAQSVLSLVGSNVATLAILMSLAPDLTWGSSLVTFPLREGMIARLICEGRKDVVGVNLFYIHIHMPHGQAGRA